ncbi:MULTISPECIES: hypothetical protein [Pseudomonadota]|uniref:hypothetical protein n=1 Tax=Pseudomonadota TaxID=1224 RepID=UPI0026144D0D|nr:MULTISPECIES: hypothetical protein [Pseudomonadota]
MISKPWENEPDDVIWLHDASGYACQILRHPTQKYLCGYVTLPEDHPFHGIDYSDDIIIPEAIYKEIALEDDWPPTKPKFIWHKTPTPLVTVSPERLLNAHGGITFSQEVKGQHVYGFDCGHSGDLSPVSLQFAVHGYVYRDWDYVTAETERLAQQLYEIASYKT